jgi:gluconolactonase
MAPSPRLPTSGRASRYEGYQAKEEIKEAVYRVEVDGNIWAGAGRGGAGCDGVHVFTPAGERIGQNRYCRRFAPISPSEGRARNQLSMVASQSLHAVYVGTRGAHIC